MSGITIMQQRVTVDDLPELERFVRSHPVRPEVATMAGPLLTTLVSGPDGIFDLWKDGVRALVGVVTDTCENATNSAELVMLGHRRRLVDADLLERLLVLAEAFVAAGPRDALCITFPSFPVRHRNILDRHGYVSARLAYVMSRANDGLVRQPALPLPDGARWVDVSPQWIEPFYVTLSAAFDAVPGAYVPSLESFRSLRLSAPIPARLLVADDKVHGFVSVEVSEGGLIGNINSRGRHPDVLGAGVGAHLLVEGLRLLSARGVARFRLHTAATNQRSLRLCRSFGFRTVHTISSYSRPVSAL